MRIITISERINIEKYTDWFKKENGNNSHVLLHELMTLSIIK